jgi:hypothetical protein
MKTKKTLALLFSEDNSGEPPEVFYPEKKGEADRFFSNLVRNVERGVVHKFTLELFTKRQVKDAKDAGDFIGGEMSDKRADAYIRRLRRSRLNRK